MALHITYFPNAFSDICQEYEFTSSGMPLKDYVIEKKLGTIGKAFYCNDTPCDLSYIPKDGDRILIIAELYTDQLSDAADNVGRYWKSTFKSVGKAFSRGNIIGGVIS